MVPSDCNLLFGILAPQMDFVERDALIAAMNAWVLRKAQPLGEILVQQGALAEDERRVLSIALARALQALAYCRLRDGEAEPGERAVRSAILLLEPLERDHPEIAENGRRLGRCLDLLGVVGIVSNRITQ